MKAIDIAPTNASVYFEKGRCIAELVGRHEVTLESLNKSIDINPQCYEAYLWKGYCRSGESVNNWNAMTQPLQSNQTARTPTLPQAVTSLALVVESDALECYDKGLAINPNDAEI